MSTWFLCSKGSTAPNKLRNETRFSITFNLKLHLLPQDARGMKINMFLLRECLLGSLFINTNVTSNKRRHFVCFHKGLQATKHRFAQSGEQTDTDRQPESEVILACLLPRQRLIIPSFLWRRKKSKLPSQYRRTSTYELSRNEQFVFKNIAPTLNPFNEHRTLRLRTF
jgi:hypothetical protein